MTCIDTHTLRATIGEVPTTVLEARCTNHGPLRSVPFIVVGLGGSTSSVTALRYAAAEARLREEPPCTLSVATSTATQGSGRSGHPDA